MQTRDERLRRALRKRARIAENNRKRRELLRRRQQKSQGQNRIDEWLDQEIRKEDLRRARAERAPKKGGCGCGGNRR